MQSLNKRSRKAVYCNIYINKSESNCTTLFKIIYNYLRLYNHLPKGITNDYNVIMNGKASLVRQLILI